MTVKGTCPTLRAPTIITISYISETKGENQVKNATELINLNINIIINKRLKHVL